MRDGGMNRRQLRLDFLAVRLEPWREHEVLAERGWIFVDRKSWSVGRELEEYATGLEEINRFEPEAVDDFGGPASRTLDPVTYFQLGIDVGYPPRDVMYTASAPPAAISVGDLLNLEVASGRAALDPERRPLFFLTEIHESEDPGEKRRRSREIALPPSHRMQPADLPLRWNRTPRPWSEHALVGRLVERDGQSVWIRERQRRGLPAHFYFTDRDAVLDETIRPVVETAQGNGERHFH